MSDLHQRQPAAQLFSAHAADSCSRAGGTIARLTEAGSSVHIVDFQLWGALRITGPGRANAQPSIEEIKHLRAEEIKEAAEAVTTIECSGILATARC